MTLGKEETAQVNTRATPGTDRQGSELRKVWRCWQCQSPRPARSSEAARRIRLSSASSSSLALSVSASLRLCVKAAFDPPIACPALTTHLKILTTAGDCFAIHTIPSVKGPFWYTY